MQNLTSLEEEAEALGHSFAVGHARQKIPPRLRPIIKKLKFFWDIASSTPSHDLAHSFKHSFARAANSSGLYGHEHFSICPTASHSIDISAAWLGMHNYKVGLIEPAFDNLYLILKRRGVEVTPINEEMFSDTNVLEAAIDSHHLQSLFLVSPNNPTGYKLDKEKFVELCTLCKRKGVTLILDSTFRFYSIEIYDEYQIMKNAEIDFLVIEDTGKTWPTEGVKLSILSYPESLTEDISEIYQELYFGPSNFSLAFLEALVKRTAEYGVENVILPEVIRRRKVFEQAVNGLGLHIERPQYCPNFPLIWMRLLQRKLPDIQFVEKLKKHDVALLPGRNFYWSAPNAHQEYLRAALMCRDETFQAGVDKLKYGLEEIRANIFRG